MNNKKETKAMKKNEESKQSRREFIKRSGISAGVLCTGILGGNSYAARESAPGKENENPSAKGIPKSNESATLPFTATLPVVGHYDVRCGCVLAKGDEVDGDIAGVSFMLHLEAVDEDRFMAALIKEDDPRQRKRIDCLRKSGKFPYPIPIFVFVKLDEYGRFMVNGNWMPAGDALDPMWRSAALLELRSRIPELLDLFRSHVPGLERCRLRAFASDLGVRETRRIRGIERMTVAAVQDGRVYSDTIGWSGYGWDLGGSRNAGQPMHGQPMPKFVPIPYGIMVPCELTNLICPGRAVSIERQVLGPVRVMASCMAMGEATGMAAGQLVKKGSLFLILTYQNSERTCEMPEPLLIWMPFLLSAPGLIRSEDGALSPQRETYY